ncbi:MAG: FtsB family cell division protein [Anaerovoracaceae bacterium]|jgi:cell division protein DivIC
MFKRKTKRSKKFKSNDQVIDIEVARNERRKKRAAAARKKTKEQKAKTPISNRQAEKRTRRRAVYCLITLFIVVVIGTSVFNIISLKMAEAEMAREQTELLEQKNILEGELEKINSAEYIEQEARHQLRMVKPGEVLYVPPNEDEETTRTGIIPN